MIEEGIKGRNRLGWKVGVVAGEMTWSLVANAQMLGISSNECVVVILRMKG